MTSVSAALLGLACGGLMVATALRAWSGLRPTSSLRRAVWASLTVAAALLAASLAVRLVDTDAPLRSQTDRAVALALVATLVTLSRYQGREIGSNTPFVLVPALLLVVWALLTEPELSAGEPIGAPVLVLAVTTIVAGGIALAALGESVGRLVTGDSVRMPHIAPVLGLLTLAMSGTALMNLWQRGTALAGSPGEAGLMAAGLAWGTAWLVPLRFVRLRAVCVTLAAMLLILVLLGSAAEGL